MSCEGSETAADKLRAYFSIHGLTQQDRNYLLGILGQAVLEERERERERCARLCEGMTLGGGAPMANRALFADAIRRSGP